MGDNNKTTINFKVDKDVKLEVQKLAKELGMPLSTIVNAQLKEILRTRTLNVSAKFRMSGYLENILSEVENDRKQGSNITKTKSVKEAIEYLNKL